MVRSLDSIRRSSGGALRRGWGSVQCGDHTDVIRVSGALLENEDRFQGFICHVPLIKSVAVAS